MQDRSDNFDEDYLIKTESYYEHARPEMMKYIPAECKKILDVGCSTGAFGMNLKTKRKDLTVWGIEPHLESALKAKKGLDKVIVGTFDTRNDELRNEKFDCIVFNDVLEHLLNPYNIIEECKVLLSDGGYIVASIPNVLFFPVFFEKIIKKEDWEYTNAGTLDKTHVRFFTKKSIIRMFQNAGYRIIQIEGINSCLYRKYRILNFIFFNKFKDWRYEQFAVQVKKTE